MKILVAHCVPRARINGMSRMMGFLHDEIANKGHQVDYFCLEDAPALRKFYPGFHRLLFPYLVLKYALAEARKGKAYDIINVHEPSGSAVVLFRRLLSAKIVVTSHGVERRNWEMRTAADSEPADRPCSKTRLIYPATLLWQADMSLRKSDHVFCLNSDDARYLTERLGRKPADVTRIFPAADPMFGQNAARRDYTRNRTLLFAGSWLVRKGTQDVVTAFADLVRRGHDIFLLILNPGPSDEIVAGQFPEDVRARLICRRTKSESETAAVFERADIFLLPSLFEGTPLTMIEAMWSGLPIVSTRTCGMRDVIEDGRNGLLINPRDSSALAERIERLLSDSALRRRLGTEAHSDAVNRFQWRLTAAPVLESYLRVLQKSRPAQLTRVESQTGRVPAAESNHLPVRES